MQRVPTTPDSFIYRGYLDDSGVDSKAVWLELKYNAPWVSRSDPSMLYRGNQLKRGKFFLMAGAYDVFYKYGYPGFQWISMLHYGHLDSMPVLKHALQQLIIDDEPLQFNHIIGTMYEHDTDEIGAHSDRINDIQPDSDIISLSFGDSREFELTPNDNATEGHIEVLHDGDMFILGPETNTTMKHAILPIHKERVLKRGGKKQGPRISVVLRQISTVVTREELIVKVDQALVDKKKRDALKG